MSKNDLQQELQKLIDLGTAVIKIETAAVAELAE